MEDVASAYGWVHQYTVQTRRERVARLGRRMRRAFTGTPVHYEQTVRERAARQEGACGLNGSCKLGAVGIVEGQPIAADDRAGHAARGERLIEPQT